MYISAPKEIRGPKFNVSTNQTTKETTEASAADGFVDLRILLLQIFALNINLCSSEAFRNIFLQIMVPISPQQSAQTAISVNKVLTNTMYNNAHRRIQMVCLACSLLFTFCTAEALVSKPALFSVRGGGSRTFGGSSLNVLDETIGDDKTTNGATFTTQDSSKQINQIRVTTKRGLSATRMPPKLHDDGIYGQVQQYTQDNISAKAYSTLSEVEDRPIPAEFIAETALPTDIGHFRLRAYRTEASANGNEYTGREPSVIYSANNPPFGVEGDLKTGVHIRIHDQCLTSEVFGSRR